MQCQLVKNNIRCGNQATNILIIETANGQKIISVCEECAAMQDYEPAAKDADRKNAPTKYRYCSYCGSCMDRLYICEQCSAEQDMPKKSEEE